MTPLVCLFLFLAMTGHSSATYCVCKDGVGEQVLQGALDYACGHGADCSAIQPTGSCYNPNTVKDHCTYAVNSYYQNSRQVAGSCVFSGAATVSATPPTNVASTCRYPSSTGTGGTTPSTGTPGTSTAFGPSGSNGTSTPNHGVAVAVLRSINSIFLALFITFWIIS